MLLGRRRAAAPRPHRRGRRGGQTAADMAALAAARSLASDPSTAPAACAGGRGDAAARANGARLVDLAIERVGAVATAVDVTASSEVDGSVPVAGPQHDTVLERARAGVTYTAALPAGSFRPVDLHGARGPLAAVAAAEAQVGWPYVWGGESRAEGGFDCSGLIDYAYAAAGLPLPGRPTAADLWHLAAPEPPGALVPGDLVFVGSASGDPHHVGMYVGAGAVVVAPHTGAAVRYEPLAAGGWDGYGRLAGPPPRGAPLDPAVERAAREHQVPAHVIAAELDLGVAADPDSEPPRRSRLPSAATPATFRRRWPTRSATLARGGRSAAAAQGPASGRGRDCPASARHRPGAARRLPNGDARRAAARRRRGPVAAVGAGSGAGRIEVITAGAQNVAGHFEETGGEVTFQGAAGLKTFGRAGVMALSAFLPRHWERDAASAAGSAWDAGIGGRRHRRRRPAHGRVRAVGGAHDAARHAVLRRLKLPRRASGRRRGTSASSPSTQTTRLRPDRRRDRHRRREPPDGRRRDRRDPAARARAVCRRTRPARRLLRLPRTDPRSGGPSGPRSRPSRAWRARRAARRAPRSTRSTRSTRRSRPP